MLFQQRPPQSLRYKLNLRHPSIGKSNERRYNTQTDTEEMVQRYNTKDFLPLSNMPLPVIHQSRLHDKPSRIQARGINNDTRYYHQSISPKQPNSLRIQQQQPVTRRNYSVSDYEQSTSISNNSPKLKLNAFISPKNQRIAGQLQHKTKLTNIGNLLTSVSPISSQEFITKYEITQEEWDKFGDRFPKNYIREKLLGRGGFSLIWLSRNSSNEQHYAIKQIPKKNKHETHLKELTFCNYFFAKGGQVKAIFRQYPGSKSLCRMFDYTMELSDVFIVYEVGGVSLGTLLYDFKVQNTTIYKLIPQSLSLQCKLNPGLVMIITKKITEIILLLSKNGWVHSDIKSENILITQSNDQLELKLIDYGSTFRFVEVFQKFSMATPEYMCPELLTFILKENHMSYDPALLTYLEQYDCEYAIDIWGLGCILLEIVSGIPLWMSFETQVINSKGAKILTNGLFAVKGRNFAKIVEKQIKIIQNLDWVLKECNYSRIYISEQLEQLIKGMLQINPKNRMNPQQILNIIDNC